jgi:hypothetical protein
MATLRASAPLTRPVPVVAAVILSALIVVANFAGFALPSGGETAPLIVVVQSIVLGIAGIPIAIGLWQLRRWGYIASIVVAALNLVFSIPGPWLAPTMAIKVFSVAFGVVSIAFLVVLTRPDARRAYR